MYLPGRFLYLSRYSASPCCNYHIIGLNLNGDVRKAAILAAFFLVAVDSIFDNFLTTINTKVFYNLSYTVEGGINLSKFSIKNIVGILVVSCLIWTMWLIRASILQMDGEARSLAMVYYHVLVGCIFGCILVRMYFHFKKTEQKYIKELCSSEERYLMMFDNSPLGIVQFDKRGTIIYCNKKFIEILEASMDKVIGCNILTHLKDADIKAAIESALAGTTGYYEGNFAAAASRKNLYLKAVINDITLDTGECLGAIAIFEDITEKKYIETEMARLERLDLIGHMSANIGHEIRNPMTTVRGFLQLLDGWETDSVKKDYYKVMINELDRANVIITEFVSLAKNKLVEFEKISINNIIDSVYPLIRVDALAQDKNVYLNKGIVPEILLDEREIRQLIFNLARNGLEAMPKGKDLSIRTYSEGNEVILAVKDEGSGINADVINKIGTPFITTKERGTGLGLAVCYSIADRHQAKIDFKSNASGTTFFVRFKVPEMQLGGQKAS